MIAVTATELLWVRLEALDWDKAAFSHATRHSDDRSLTYSAHTYDSIA